ncbi:10 kDa chaperonin [Capsicum annuum]|nr:10 kDa chaperonin [Capsicum annuum]
MNTLRIRFHRLVSIVFKALFSKRACLFAPSGDRVLVKIEDVEEKSVDDILFPTSAQLKTQGDEVVAVRKGRSIGKTTVEISMNYHSVIIDIHNLVSK